MVTSPPDHIVRLRRIWNQHIHEEVLRWFGIHTLRNPRAEPNNMDGAETILYLLKRHGALSLSKLVEASSCCMHKVRQDVYALRGDGLVVIGHGGWQNGAHRIALTELGRQYVSQRT